MQNADEVLGLGPVPEHPPILQFDEVFFFLQSTDREDVPSGLGLGAGCTHVLLDDLGLFRARVDHGHAHSERPQAVVERVHLLLSELGRTQDFRSDFEIQEIVDDAHGVFKLAGPERGNRRLGVPGRGHHLVVLARLLVDFLGDLQTRVDFVARKTLLQLLKQAFDFVEDVLGLEQHFALEIPERQILLRNIEGRVGQLVHFAVGQHAHQSLQSIRQPGLGEVRPVELEGPEHFSHFGLIGHFDQIVLAEFLLK